MAPPARPRVLHPGARRAVRRGEGRRESREGDRVRAVPSEGKPEASLCLVRGVHTFCPTGASLRPQGSSLTPQWGLRGAHAGQRGRGTPPGPRPHSPPRAHTPGPPGGAEHWHAEPGSPAAERAAGGDRRPCGRAPSWGGQRQPWERRAHGELKNSRPAAGGGAPSSQGLCRHSGSTPHPGPVREPSTGKRRCSPRLCGPGLRSRLRLPHAGPASPALCSRGPPCTRDVPRLTLGPSLWDFLNAQPSAINKPSPTRLFAEHPTPGQPPPSKVPDALLDAPRL